MRLERGAERLQAARESGQVLAIPLLTSSLTTIFAFMPMLLVEGSAGEYVRSLAQVVAILLLGSWLLSMTVTPAMCAWFMKVDPVPGGAEEPAHDSFVYRLYRRLLVSLLRWRLVTIAVLVALFFGSLSALQAVKTEFFPLGDRNQLLVQVDFEAGTDIRETQADVRRLTGWLADEEMNAEVTSHVAYVGCGAICQRTVARNTRRRASRTRLSPWLARAPAKEKAPATGRGFSLLDVGGDDQSSPPACATSSASSSGRMRFRMIAMNAAGRRPEASSTRIESGTCWSAPGSR